MTRGERQCSALPIRAPGRFNGRSLIATTPPMATHLLARHQRDAEESGGAPMGAGEARRRASDRAGVDAAAARSERAVNSPLNAVVGSTTLAGVRSFGGTPPLLASGRRCRNETPINSLHALS